MPGRFVSFALGHDGSLIRGRPSLGRNWSSNDTYLFPIIGSKLPEVSNAIELPLSSKTTQGDSTHGVLHPRPPQ